MRNLQSVFLSFGLLLLVACGADSEKDARLQGTWNATYIERGGEEVTGQTVAFTLDGSDYTYTAGSHYEEGELGVKWAENQLTTD